VEVLRLWLGAELRRRWRAHVALALLIGVVGSVLLTVAAGARTTASAYDRFVNRQAIPTVEFDSLEPGAVEALRSLPAVEAAGAYAPMFAAPKREGVLAGQDFIVFAAADRQYGRTVDRPIVLQGRLPRPDAVDEVAVNAAGAAKYKIAVGSQTQLSSLAFGERDALFAGHLDQLTFSGPTPTVRVVGVVRTRLDLGHVSYAANYFLATPAFFDAYGDKVADFTPQFAARLKNPADGAHFVAAARDRVQRDFPNSADQFNGRVVSEGITSIRDASRVQALSLTLVVVAAAIAGLLGLALMAVRSVSAMSAEFPALRAIGVGRTGWTRMTALASLPAALVGALVAIVGATLASPLFPTAVARQTGPPPGVSFDAVTLPLGAALIALFVVGAAALAAYRWRPVASVQGGLYVGPFDRLAGALPPSPRIGVRWALPRRDATAGPGRAALAGAVIGVCALVAALTFAAGLTHLVTTPSAYGWTFDVDGGGGSDVNQTNHLRDSLLHNPAVGDVGLARVAGSAHLDNAIGDTYGFESVRGRIGPAVLTGRAAATDDEIVLAAKTARQLHKGVGQTVHLVLGPGAPPATLRVVGIGMLPTIESDRLAVGAAMTRTGLERIAGDNQFFAENTHVDALFRVNPRVNRARALAQLRKDGLINQTAAPPGDVHNLDLVRSYPRWLAGFLAAIGLLTAINALVVTARRRSQQVGVLRALGLTRGQVVAAVSTQGAALCVVGVVVGVPLGVALGRWTWSLSAHQLGVGEGAVVPVAVLVIVLGGGLGLLLALGASAGWWAGRSTPSNALRVP